MSDKDQTVVILHQAAHSTWEHFQVRFSEWFGAGCLCAWGVYVSTHPGMFSAPATRVVFSGMVEIMAQPSWGLMATIVGIIRLGALYVNGHHRKTPSIRLAASFFSAFVWTQIVIGLFNSGVAQTGVIIYTGMVCADIYSAFRASGDVTLMSTRFSKAGESKRDGSPEAHS